MSPCPCSVRLLKKCICLPLRTGCIFATVVLLVVSIANCACFGFSSDGCITLRDWRIDPTKKWYPMELETIFHTCSLTGNISYLVANLIILAGLSKKSVPRIVTGLTVMILLWLELQ